MGSNYFGELNLGNERSSSSSSGSSRKSKKNNSEKPNKQPQRGLGVAQLEKIRLHSEMGCANNYLPSLHNNNPYANNLTQEDMRLQTAYSSSSSFSYSTSSSAHGFPSHQGIMMGMSGAEGANIRYGDSQPSSRPSTWHPGIVYEPQHYAQPNMTRHLHTMQVEDSMERRRKKDRSDSIGSSNSEELDLELRLSL
ncbi:protein SPEAR1-like [Lycium ferocissimum]|uniref:protein SPEAR1-like n=1 Tax=Lycium ferocissimum TaxID=112874 RepID=UPI002815C24B|nr:protein SPEAR1-like [Lycium ferocissimum]